MNPVKNLLRAPLVKGLSVRVLQPIRDLGAAISAGRRIGSGNADSWSVNQLNNTGISHRAQIIFEEHGIDMPKPQSDPGAKSLIDDTDRTTFQECRTLARVELTMARNLLCGEIANYPTPIAGCDCQFNYLLAERKRITQAIGALDHNVHTGSAK